MMRIILSCVFFLMLTTSAASQVYVEGKNINEDSSIHLIEIVHGAHPGVFWIEYIDIGDAKNRTRLTDDTGKRLSLKSGIDLINFMKKNGWTLQRRDMLYRGAPGGGTTLAFLLFERMK